MNFWFDLIDIFFMNEIDKCFEAINWNRWKMQFFVRRLCTAHCISWSIRPYRRPIKMKIKIKKYKRRIRTSREFMMAGRYWKDDDHSAWWGTQQYQPTGLTALPDEPKWPLSTHLVVVFITFSRLFFYFISFPLIAFAWIRPLHLKWCSKYSVFNVIRSKNGFYRVRQPGVLLRRQGVSLRMRCRRVAEPYWRQKWGSATRYVDDSAGCEVKNAL